MPALIAFDTSTERMTVALRHGERVVAREGEGGARASATLLPAVLGVLADAGIALAELDAIAFGRGPGAFTGLRTACAVAQGLALGARKPVLPIDTLLAVAEDARRGAADVRVWALLDARMDQVYAAEYAHANGRWSTLVAPFLADCEALAARWRDEPPMIVAGNALVAFGARLDARGACSVADATPHATALLRVAEQAWSDGAAVDPALALPLYVRDKVAETESERAARSLSVSAAPNRAAPSPLRSPSSEREGRSPSAPRSDR
nr:tRNA (adenosine(37)-N6)-threonylcarbamoyltransferase complex dimerization subunit type 1 TsaB [Caldimonas sp.]